MGRRKCKARDRGLVRREVTDAFGQGWEAGVKSICNDCDSTAGCMHAARLGGDM